MSLPIVQLLLLIIIIDIINVYSSSSSDQYDKEKPEFFLIGAMKCGTTTLFSLLTQHKEICDDENKEKHYFDKDSQGYLKGYKFYLSLFKGCDPNQFYLDATPRYINIDVVVPRLVETYGSTLLAKKKFILILREPVARHYSEYQMRVRVCKSAFNNNEDVTRVERNCNRITKNFRDWSEKGHWKSREHELKFFTFAEWIVHEDGQSEMRRGHYIEHISLWLKGVNRSQLFIINFATLVGNTADTMTRLSKFLGLKNDWGPNASLPVPHYSSPDTYIDCKSYDYLFKYYENINKHIIEYINNNQSKSIYEPVFPPFTYHRETCKDV